MEIETPYIRISQEVMERNITGMSALADRLQVKLRPHVKTHKMPEVAKLQLQAGAAGITVAKLGEAEVMAEHGIRDIFMAYPMAVLSKMERAVRLARSIDLSLGVDSLEAAEALSRLAAAEGIRLAVRLEIDTGLQRTGVQAERAGRLAYAVSKLPGLNLNGIFTYRGSFFKGTSTLDVEAAGLEEGRLMAALADELRSQGIAIEHVSVGSTPTAPFAGAVKGVSEIRPGTYVFHDSMQLRLGVCSLEDCAARVVVSVVSLAEPDRVVVDGGSKAFATDVQPGQPPLMLRGFGTVVGYPEAVLERMNEEHGMIRMNAPHSLKLGDKLEIIPNHICSTVNLYDAVYLADGNGVSRLPVRARGRSQ